MGKAEAGISAGRGGLANKKVALLARVSGEGNLHDGLLHVALGRLMGEHLPWPDDAVARSLMVSHDLAGLAVLAARMGGLDQAVEVHHHSVPAGR